VGPKLEDVGSSRSVGAFKAFFLPFGCSFRLPSVLGAKVDGAWDDSCRGRFTEWLYLVAKPSHVGGQCAWANLPSAPAYSL
jgi:hypothetical protein